MARKVKISKVGASTIVKIYEEGNSASPSTLRTFNGDHNIEAYGSNIIVGNDSTMTFLIGELETPFVGTPEAYLTEMATNLFFTSSKSV